jgi:hypothetical protein
VRAVILTTAVTLAAIATLAAAAQRRGVFSASRDHPAVAYSTAKADTPVSALDQAIREGRVTLAYDPANGYLQSVLTSLGIVTDSQVLVYSETSFQARHIGRHNPRALFFNDHTYVGWVRGGEVLEVAVQDRRQGMIFYTVPQTPVGARFTRNDNCLSCHLSWETLAVPGLVVLTTMPRRSTLDYANGFHTDHRVPFAERWGGWYVTGTRVPRSMANLELLQPALPASGPTPVSARSSLAGSVDLTGYPRPFSDVAALMVLEHQARATNLITRAGWEFRLARHHSPGAAALTPAVREAVDELVDYLLFVDEAPFPGPVRGSSGFADRFSAMGPRDRLGRSLRELQLETRLMRYPLSYMVYSPGFAGLPAEVRRAVGARWEDVLSGRDRRPKYAHLTPDLRRAIQEILADTLPPDLTAP